MSSTPMDRGKSGLVGFAYESGRIVCVDCDIYPPNTVDVREDEAGDLRCFICDQPLTAIDPVGGR